MMEREKLRSIELAPRVVSFATVEDFLGELKERPPDGGLIRVERRILDSRADKHGIGLRTGSVMLSAKRGEELLVANFVTGYMQTLNRRPFGSEEEIRLNQENVDKALAVLEEEVRRAGFAIGRGVYALPEDLLLYQARSRRLAFQDGRVVDAGRDSS